MPYKDRADYNANQRAKRAAGRKSSAKSKSAQATFWDNPSFVAWDGEGVTTREQSGLSFEQFDDLIESVAAYLVATGERPHRARLLARHAMQEFRPQPATHYYTLLANSRGAYIEDPCGISTERALRFLLDEAEKYPKAKHVIFSGSYDCNMILRGARTTGEVTGVSREDLVKINKSKEWGTIVSLGGAPFAIGARWRRKLYVGEYVAGHVWEGRKRRPPRRTATLWDVWGFFQGTFVSALRDWFGDDVAAIVPHIDRIEEMKRNRAHFSSLRPEDIRAYCLDECRALEKLCDKVAASMIEADLRPTRFDGAGAVAGALLGREGVREFIAEPPPEVAFGVRCAYAGGRIEIAQLGALDAVVDYDVTSCYPSKMAGMPSLALGWERCAEPGDFTLSCARFAFPDDLPWYPLFYRTPERSILFPSKGMGWYYGPEIALAQHFANRFGGHLEVLGSFRPIDDGSRPFAFVPDLYETRLRFKREGRAAERIIKVSSNSIYGKLCQQLGGTQERRPPYFALPWAGYITSAARAQLGEAALRTDPTNIVAFQTDGLFVRSPIAGLAAPGLGGWEEKTPQGGVPTVIAQAGVYWYGRDDWTARYRGFDRDGMATPERVLRAWERGERSVEVSVTRFVTARSALQSERLWPSWATWRTAPRTLAIDGRSAKREAIALRAKPHRKPVALRPSWNAAYEGGGIASAPYPLAWLETEGPATVDGVSLAAYEEEVTDSL